MISVRNVQKYVKYINITCQGYKKTATITQCKNFSNINEEFKSGKQLLKASSSSCNGINLWSQFKTSSASYAEESDVLEANKDDKKISVDPSKDRTKIISPETSIRYMKSEAYKTTYGEEPVWVKYRRAFRGQFTPKRTRKTCIRGGVISCGTPCPICRDEYLVLHYTNVQLLKQFIRPETGEIYKTQIIHICQKKLFELEIALKKAKSYGFITYEVPFRSYDYSEYYPQLEK